MLGHQILESINLLTEESKSAKAIFQDPLMLQTAISSFGFSIHRPANPLFSYRAFTGSYQMRAKNLYLN